MINSVIDMTLLNISKTNQVVVDDTASKLNVAANTHKF